MHLPVRLALVSIGLLVLTACSTSQIGTLYQRGWTDASAPRDLFVAIDGTSSTPVERTNAARLFEIVDVNSGSSGRPLATYYAEGVGSNGNLLGSGAGLGMADDIRNAYEFLTVHYRPGDRIFLTGFSRGAYAVRVVGGLVAVAGIPDLTHLSPGKRRKVVDDIFDAFKTGRTKGESRMGQMERRMQRVRAALAGNGIAERGMDNATPIEAMAIWDTVEALGIPDGTADPREEVPYYLLTNCNVKHIFHALALDDNRASNFTPIFADAEHMTATCEGERGSGNRNESIEEVWFAGSHSDTSGTYATNDGITDHLHGVSLNWMLEQFEKRKFGLFPAGHRVFEDPFAAVHDAREALAIYKAWEIRFREPIAYQRLTNPARRPRIHASAIARLSIAKSLDPYFASCREPDVQAPLRSFEPKRAYKLLCARDLASAGLVAELRTGQCLAENDRGFALIKGQKCVDVVGTMPRHWPEI